MPKVLLRPVEPDDVGFLYKWLNDDEVNYGSLFRTTPPLSRILIRQRVESGFYCNDDRKYYIIAVDDVSIGLVTLTRIDYTKRSADCDLMIGEKEYRNRGIALKAALLMFDFCFEVLGFNKLHLGTFTYNRASVVLQAQAGARYEGALRQFHYRFGKYWDRLLFAVDRDVWASIKQNNSVSET